MGFFSNIKRIADSNAVRQVVPQEGVDPQQNLQNLEGSGFLGKALANAIRSGAIQRVPAEAAFQAVQKVVEPVAAAQEAATASPQPAPATATPYTVTPQNLSIGRTSYRSLPANMLSRLSLASLKDILKRYEEEGEEVPRYADGGPVLPTAGAMSTTPGATPGGLIPSSTPVTQDQMQTIISDLVKAPADFPAAKAPPGYRMADRSLEELGFVPQECGPMGCVGFQVVTDYANPKTGEYVTLGTPFAGQLPEGWVKVNPTSYDAEGNVIGGGTPKRIYGEVDRIAPVMPAPAPTQPGSPYEVRPHSMQMGQTRTSYIPDSVMRNLSGRSMENLYQQYGQDQSAETARMMPANDLLEFLRKNRMV
jgi:hypothetical protein